MYTCIYIYINRCLYIYTNISVYAYVYVYVYVYVCIHIYNIYIYLFKCIQINVVNRGATWGPIPWGGGNTGHGTIYIATPKYR